MNPQSHAVAPDFRAGRDRSKVWQRTARRSGPALILFVLAGTLFAQTPPAGRGFPSAEERQRLQELSSADHRAMLEQLGIKRLRPGPNGRAAAGEPNAANYDETKANPYPDYPDPLVLRSGERVSTSQQWWQQRRPEIVEAFEREVYGRVPARTPGVTWTVTQTATTTLADLPVIAKELTGRVDNAAHPDITVELKMVVVTPAKAAAPVPVLMMFGFPSMPGSAGNAPAFGGKAGGANAPSDPPSTQQLIAAGWGYATLSPASIQADNGAGLTRGIIGLVNRGERRKPEDWGALRAWAWGAARGLDYLETDSAVDAKRVGIEGVSRYGKAALVTLAFEPRFALALIGSSGAGGVKPHRRNFGEAVENLTGSGQYHWMAGNFLKYAAAEATFGSKTAHDLPVDSPELIALCAPRPVFISYGIPEKGDAHWLDQQGSYMAAVAAGPVFRLLGARDLGERRDYRAAKMPPVNTGLLDGELAWRQHDGGHEDRSNMKHFIAWANRLLVQSAPAAADATKTTGVQPVARTDRNSQLAHQQLLEKAKQGRIDVYFMGDSITRRWGATDYPEFLAHWKKSFFGWNAANFGWGGDMTLNMLWRIQNGELDGVNPKVVVLLAGTNDIGRDPGDGAKVAAITRRIETLLETIRAKAPAATIILTAIFPRNDNPAVLPTINAINANLARFADGRRIRFLNVNDRLADEHGLLKPGMSPDKLHLAVPGYEVWAQGLRPLLTELLGPPAATDSAPPPTGDPSAKR